MVSRPRWTCGSDESEQFSAYFFPRDQFHLASVYLHQASLDLFRPSCFNVRLGNRDKRVDKQSSEGSSIAFGQLRCLMKTFFEASFHNKKITPRVDVCVNEHKTRSISFAGGLMPSVFRYASYML